MTTKIVIVGLGGVGGYYGGLLSRKYENDSNIEIYFIARGAHLEKIQKDGLTVKCEHETFVTKPTLATNDAKEIGEADYILLCTKSYDLEASIEQIKICVGPNTILLPLLNGISITQIIRKLLPQNEVLHGCVYIIARLIEPGVVGGFGGTYELFFGSEKTVNDKIQLLEKIMQDSKIKAKILPDILTKIWGKFFLISTFATTTSYFNVSFGAIFTDQNRLESLTSIMDELLEVAHAENIPLQRDLIESTLQIMKTVPFDSTSSMHSDFQAGRKTELEILTHIVIQLAEKHNINVPVYKKMYDELLKKK